jgi:hypothetical protein
MTQSPPLAMRPNRDFEVDDLPADLPPNARLDRLARAAMLVLAVVTLISWLLVAFAHAGDRYGIGWVQGSWMALAKYAHEGVLYPPLYDGTSYGGTRFMPIPVILHAGMASITNEYLLSGKLVGYASFAIMLAVAFAVLRRLKCPPGVALAFVALIIVTNSAFLAATRIQGDALPVALQLAAVSLIAWFSDRRATIAAAALCAVAVVSKASAVWAPLAIGLWLALRDPRRLILFGAMLALLLGAMLAGFQLLSDGRMLGNLYALTFAGVGGAGTLLRSPVNLLWQLATFASASWALFPIAVFGAITNAGRREAEIFHVALGCSIVVTLVVMADQGATQNHLIDLVALITVTAGAVWPRVASQTAAHRTMRTALLLVVLWLGATSYVLTLYPETKTTLESLVRGERDPGLRADVMAGYLDPAETMLSEDPFVAVSVGQLPVVLDAWMFRKMTASQPQWADALAERIERGEFSKIVLTRPLEGNEFWYRTVHFGPRVSEAIQHRYHFSERVANYFVYAPNAAR